ncbi:MAG: phospholipase D family protein [Burkholderiales bacterium]
MRLRLALRTLAAACALTLAACGTLAPHAERPVSMALKAPGDSALVRVAQASAPSPGSGFRLMPHGLYSLDARIELIRRAQSSIDAQYYIVADDRSGRLFMRTLRSAAMRGVRVRLLVDDLYTAGADPMFTGLAAFPNVEVRLFNPFCCARKGTISRFAASLMDVQRLNHRMHNKMFIVDGAMAVMGGRNVADEYFARGVRSNFVDMDVLVVGDVVPQLARIFDTYWNSAQAYDIDAIVTEPEDPKARRAAFDRRVDEGDQMMSVNVPAMDMLAQRPLAEEIDGGRLRLAPGRAVAFADQPAKVMATDAEMARTMSVQMNIMDRVTAADRQVVISSPYFIPGEGGVKSFADLRARGVDVVILTNSQAANDVPLAHIGYARYRVAMVRAGVSLYELSAAGGEHEAWDSLPGMSQGRLHAKVAVWDGSMVYIGSMNLDPRSESTNTELGIVVQSAELAASVVRVIDATRRQGSYRVRFAADGERLEWIGMGASTSVLTSEPDVTPFAQFRNMLLAPFVPEQLL